MRTHLVCAILLSFATSVSAKKIHSGQVIQNLTGLAGAAAQQQQQMQQPQYEPQYQASTEPQKQLMTEEAQQAYKQGCELLANKRYQDSIPWFDRVSQLEPNFPKTFNCRATAYRFIGHFEMAEHDVSTALIRDPNYPMATLQRGLLRLLAGHDAEGTQDIQRAYAMRPALAPDFDPQVSQCRNFARAKGLIVNGQAAEAVPLLDNFIANFPECYQGYLQRGIAKRQQDAGSQAIEDLNRTLALYPSSAIAFGELALATAESGTEISARESLNKCLNNDRQLGEKYAAELDELLRKLHPPTPVPTNQPTSTIVSVTDAIPTRMPPSVPTIPPIPTPTAAAKAVSVIQPHRAELSHVASIQHRSLPAGNDTPLVAQSDTAAAPITHGSSLGSAGIGIPPISGRTIFKLLCGAIGFSGVAIALRSGRRTGDHWETRS